MEPLTLNVIIPVYNEEGSIKNVLQKWSTEFERLQINFQIHIYNDGSKDNTLQILNNMAATNNKIVVHDKPNSGHGPTILKGYKENCHAEWIFQIDSDDELGPEAFELLWLNRHNYDFLLGSRIERNSPLTRKIITLVSRLTVWFFYGTGITDVNSPYRLMRAAKLAEYLDRIPSDSFAPNVILSGIVVLKKFKIFETPVKYKFRTTGEVSIKKFKLFKAALKSFMQTILFRFKV